MQVVILAAGKGTRLTGHKNGVPKCLVDVGQSRPYLWHQLEALSQAGRCEIILVGGYGIEHLESFLGQESFPGVRLVCNPDYEKANLYSLLTVRERLRSDFFIFNADHFYAPEVYHQIFTSPKKNITAFCDHDRKLATDDMKVLATGGRIGSMAKDLASWNLGYVGVTYVPHMKQSVYWRACDEMAHRLSDGAYVEAVLNHMAGRGEDVAVADVSGYWWTEIDTPEDLARAREVLKKNYPQSGIHATLRSCDLASSRKVAKSPLRLCTPWSKRHTSSA